MYFSEIDRTWMRHALRKARESAAQGEVPVGAVITIGGNLLSCAANNPIATNDPTAHAEINAIRYAAAKTENYRLIDTTLYVTLEPCLMCMGAIIHARIDRLVYGAHDPKTGAAVSTYRIGTDGIQNHSLRIEGGLLAEQCGELLRSFFRQRRR